MSAVVAVFRDPDLRKKILFTIAMIILYRVGSQIPSPGIDYVTINERLSEISNQQNSVYQLINLFSGGALLQLSIFAIGIMPYITASIIVQLLTVVIPKFEELKKEGQSGQAKMTEYTRYLTVALALLQSSGIVALAQRGQLLGDIQVLKPGAGIFESIIIVLAMTAGAILVMWLGELITENGIGNGMSLLIFAVIATRIPADGLSIYRGSGTLAFIMVLIGVMILVLGVIFIEQGQRRIPVQYAKRMVGRRQYGGTSTYLPLKVNQAGVIPVIFASSLIYVPVLITQIITSSTGPMNNWWQREVIQYLQTPSSYQYILLYLFFVIFFSFFYTFVQYDPYEQADNMKKYGGFIPGVRPGRPTAEYLSYVMSRLLFVGSIYLGAIAVAPNILIDLGINTSGGTHGSLPFGGTAILILVSVALTTVQQIESQLMQSNYEGFLK